MRFARSSGRALPLSRRPAATRTVTGDRRGFIGRNGTLRDPAALQFAHLSGRVGPLLDPCGAVQANMTVAARLDGRGDFPSRRRRGRSERARSRCEVRRSEKVEAAFDRSRALGTSGCGAVEVETPDKALNMLTNRWLVYQALSCRCLRAVGVLPVGRSVRLSRSASGRARAAAFRSGHRPPATSFAPQAGSFQKEMFSTGGMSPAARASGLEFRTIACGSYTPRSSTRGRPATGRFWTRGPR